MKDNGLYFMVVEGPITSTTSIWANLKVKKNPHVIVHKLGLPSPARPASDEIRAINAIMTTRDRVHLVLYQVGTLIGAELLESHPLKDRAVLQTIINREALHLYYYSASLINERKRTINSKVSQQYEYVLAQTQSVPAITWILRIWDAVFGWILQKLNDALGAQQSKLKSECCSPGWICFHYHGFCD